MHVQFNYLCNAFVLFCMYIVEICKAYMKFNDFIIYVSSENAVHCGTISRSDLQGEKSFIGLEDSYAQETLLCAIFVYFINSRLLRIYQDCILFKSAPSYCAMCIVQVDAPNINVYAYVYIYNRQILYISIFACNEPYTNPKRLSQPHAICYGHQAGS